MQQALIRFQRWEIALCQALQGWLRSAVAQRPFILASRLGDGPLWYGLLVGLLLVFGWPVMPVVGQMAVTGAVAVILYTLIKRGTRRLRPYEADPTLVPATPALDRYSFPSGHTLHAVCFTTLSLAHFPLLGLALVPVAATIAASRVVLGLHYPTDVLAGALLGLALALISLQLPFGFHGI